MNGFAQRTAQDSIETRIACVGIERLFISMSGPARGTDPIDTELPCSLLLIEGTAGVCPLLSSRGEIPERRRIETVVMVADVVQFDDGADLAAE